MNRFRKWAEHEYSKKQRVIAVVFGGFNFWIVILFFIIIASLYIDQWFNLPKFRYGLLNPVTGSICIVIGWLFANWTVGVQFSWGKGTPIPLMATRKLIVKGPYAYCRNPMTLGTDLFYLGIAMWLGSFSAITSARPDGYYSSLDYHLIDGPKFPQDFKSCRTASPSLSIMG